ncbi:MAG: SDR family oxidoreductase [Thermoplasmata archaeon]|nr:SDR family oxidoreductase [Thermoplasmata archaeon]MCI4357227.1 SDR family oxidoreductase [Thermoplasmata archaeon]
MASPTISAPNGMTCIVTGGSSGIGEETAAGLAAIGARVIIVGKDARRAEEALARIRARHPPGPVEAMVADLGRRSEVERLAAALQASCPRIDVLVNNAGAMFGQREQTEDGIEKTLAVNVLAPFLLTELLTDRLRASAPARVVNLSSDAHRRARLDLADLQGAGKYNGWRAYCNSKLEILLLTKEFARRLQGSGVTVHAVNPGRVNTRFGLGNSGLFVLALRTFQRVLGIPPAEAARHVLFVATAPSVASSSGAYYFRDRPTPSSDVSLDAGVAARLWQECTALTHRSTDS